MAEYSPQDLVTLQGVGDEAAFLMRTVTTLSGRNFGLVDAMNAGNPESWAVVRGDKAIAIGLPTQADATNVAAFLDEYPDTTFVGFKKEIKE